MDSPFTLESISASRLREERSPQCVRRAYQEIFAHTVSSCLPEFLNIALYPQNPAPKNDCRGESFAINGWYVHSQDF